jgi:hypothetical protein
MRFQDLVGQKFNKLTVLEYVGKNKSGQSRWLCLCDCGNKHEALASHLKTGNIKSCGCMNSSHARSLWATTHGYSYTPEWNSYHAAKKRCNPKYAHLKNNSEWSGRGIEFRFDTFEDFLAEVGERPEPKFDYSLDRIDNNGHYEKGNVRWATKKQQARNRRCDRCLKLEERLLILEKRVKELTQ